MKSNNITFDYNYYPPDYLIALLKEELKVNFRINYINLTVDCIVIPTKHGRLQEDDLFTLKGLHINYVTTEQDHHVPCMIDKEQKLLISDYIDEQVLIAPALRAYNEEAND